MACLCDRRLTFKQLRDRYTMLLMFKLNLYSPDCAKPLTLRVRNALLQLCVPLSFLVRMFQLIEKSMLWRINGSRKHRHA